ncbi:MAG: hypothetical protein FWD15_01665 [Alphaproteobacteria bacterium]|nr:hypothetical protein [Alphaproteobacteria bacterium]
MDEYYKSKKEFIFRYAHDSNETPMSFDTTGRMFLLDEKNYKTYSEFQKRSGLTEGLVFEFDGDEDPKLGEMLAKLSRAMAKLGPDEKISAAEFNIKSGQKNKISDLKKCVDYLEQEYGANENAEEKVSVDIGEKTPSEDELKKVQSEGPSVLQDIAAQTEGFGSTLKYEEFGSEEDRAAGKRDGEHLVNDNMKITRGAGFNPRNPAISVVRKADAEIDLRDMQAMVAGVLINIERQLKPGERFDFNLNAISPAFAAALADAIGAFRDYSPKEGEQPNEHILRLQGILSRADMKPSEDFEKNLVAYNEEQAKVAAEEEQKKSEAMKGGTEKIKNLADNIAPENAAEFHKLAQEELLKKAKEAASDPAKAKELRGKLTDEQARDGAAQIMRAQGGNGI